MRASIVENLDIRRKTVHVQEEAHTRAAAKGAAKASTPRVAHLQAKEESRRGNASCVA